MIVMPDSAQANTQDTEQQPSPPHADIQDIQVQVNSVNVSSLNPQKVRIKNKILSSHKRLNFEPRVLHNMCKHYKVQANTCNVSKVAQYKTDILKQKYVFPKKENECSEDNMHLRDDRTMLEVLGDVIGIVTEHYKPSEVEFLSRQCGYDASIRMFSSTGQPLPLPLLKDMVKSYKQMKGLKSVGKAVQELAQTEDKFYSVENGEVSETVVPPTVNTVTDTQDDTHVALDKLYKAAVSFVPFIEENQWILASARLRRQFKILKDKLRNKKSFTSKKLLSFLKSYYFLYYNESNDTWNPPLCNPEAFPGHVFYIAKGAKLKYIPCSMLNKNQEIKNILFLADSGASHNLIMLSTLKQLDADVFPLKRRRLHLFTASGEEKDTVKGECYLELKLRGQYGKEYSFCQPFLVVGDNMNMERPILGMPFLIDQDCQAAFKRDKMSALMTDSEGKSVRVMLPSYQGSSTNPHTSTIRSYDDIYQAPVHCFSVSDFSFCSESLPTEVLDKVSDYCTDSGYSTGEEEESYSSIESSARELAAQCHLVYPNTKAHEIFTDLGGKGEEVPLEVREEADEQIFREIDLLSAGDDVREHRDMGEIDSKFMSKCSSRLDSLLKTYDKAFSSETRKIGKFKYFMYTPDVIEGSSSKQAIRPQKTMHFKNVQEKIKTLEENGIIGVSPDQSTQYVHNLLFLSKRKASEAGRNATKADLHIAGHNHRLTDPDIKVRCINDLSDFNRKCLKAAPTIYLPTQMEIQDFVKGKVVSSFDITEMFSSIPLHPDAYKYFNFYLNAKIYCFKVLLQGCSASPFVATEALSKTFDENVWEALKSRLGQTLKMLFHYYTSFQEFIKSFMDDILLASYVICRCPDGHCEKSFQCPTMQFEETAELHCQCIEALYYAISEAGFLLNPEKSQYFVHSQFVFIGLSFDAVRQSFSIADDRVKSIMSFRTPRSIPEVHSRVSSLRWSAPFLPFLNKILLPLIQLCSESTFRWEKRHMEAFNNAKFLVGLCLQKYAFRPDRPHILVSDSSKYSLSYTLYTVDPGGMIQLCETETKICSGAESRLQAVNRELICLLFAIKKCEKYIFASEKSFIALGDFQSIMYLQLNAPHDSRVGQASIYLSKFTNKLKLCFMAGRHMGLADIFSRQFSNVYLKREDTHISKTLAQHLPPIPPQLRKKLFLMDGDQLCDFVFSKIKSTHLDLWDHASHVRQDFRLNDFKSMFREFEPLQGLLRYLKDPYCLKNLDYETLREYFLLLRDSTKTNINQFLKNEKLLWLKDIIQGLDFESNWRKVFGVKPPSPAAVSLSQEIPAVQASSELPDSQDECEPQEQVTAKQCVAIERMCLPYVFVSAVTRSQAKANESSECPVSPGPLNISQQNAGCPHYRVARAQHGRFPEAAYEKFCESYSYWLQTAQNLKKLLSDLHENTSKTCQKAKQQLESFESNPCFVVKFFIYKDLLVSISQTRPSDWLTAMTPDTDILAYSVCPDSDFEVQESPGCLSLCSKIDIHMDGMEQLELKGSIGFLSEDVTIETAVPKPLHIYHQSSQLNISLINCISLFNSSITPITLPAGSPLFKVYSTGQKESTLFASVAWQHGQTYFDQVLSLMSFNAERHLVSVFSDYLCQSRERLLEAAQAAEQKMLARLSQPVSTEHHQQPTSQRRSPSPAPARHTEPQGPVTRARRRRMSDPLCTAHHMSGPVNVFSLSDLDSNASGTESGGQIYENTKQTNRRAYHGQHMLSQLLFSHYMRKAQNKIDKPQIIALQNSDNFLLKIKDKLKEKGQNCEEEEASGLFFLENEILYKNMYIKEHNITYKALALPQFLVKSILINLHSRYGIHLDSQSMYQWLKLHLYCHNIMDLVKAARASCVDCMYGLQARTRQVGGNQLFYRNLQELGPGSVMYSDLLFLAHDKSVNANCLLICVDAITKYTQVAICQSKSSDSIIKAFKQIFNCGPPPCVLVTDAGSEYTSQEVREFLNGMGVELYYVSSKNSQLAEVHIRVLKTYMNRLLQSEDLQNSEWSQILNQSLLLMNSRPPNKSCVLSRAQLFFSPLHYVPKWMFNVKTEEKESLNLLKSHLKLLHKGRVQYKPKRQDIPIHAQKGNVVILEKPRQTQKAVNNSQQLLPSFEKILKIQKVLSDGKCVIGKDLLSGDKLKHNVGQLRPLHIDRSFPFPNKHVKLEHLSGLVSPSHGIETARNFTSLPNPKVFSVEAPDQSQASKSGSDQSEVPLPKSILKVRSQQTHQPYQGVLSQDADGRAQWEAYVTAYYSLRELQYQYPNENISIPDWLDNLIKQPSGHGCLYGVLDSCIFPAKKCSHGKNIHFSPSQVFNEFKDRRSQQNISNTRLKHCYCVSEREFSSAFIAYSDQLLDTDQLSLRHR